MNSVVIKQFDSNQLTDIARSQTQIYNESIAQFPDYLPARVDEVVTRFRSKEFDHKRMFYAYEGSKMVGYAGLSSRDIKNNLRTVGYPWLVKETPSTVRNILYDSMEKQCRREGTKIMRTFVSENYPDIMEFFTSKNFTITQEFIKMEKILSKNEFKIPNGYKFRSLRRDDLPKLETIALHDRKLKYRFTPSDWNQFINLNEFNIDDTIVAEKDGKVVGFYSISISDDPSKTKAFIAAEAIDSQHQIIEPYLAMELENRAFERGKKSLETAFYIGSERLNLSKERGFQEMGINFRLDKFLY